jgi:Transposase DDE domain
MLTPGRTAMLAGTLHTWIKRQIAVRQRLERVCTSYLLFLMVVTTKHSLHEAARFSGLHPALFSKMLQAHTKVAITTLESLSKTQARQFAKTLARVNGLPWKIVIIIDSTLQHRASLHPENAQTFNHGKGYVVGHQWTNVVLVLGGILIPLKPIPFYSKRYCQTHALAYHSEHERVVAYLGALDLEAYLGAYDRREVLVLADSGYDDKKIEQAITAKGWYFIIALSKTRSVKSPALALHTPTSQQWCHIDTFFRRHRRLKWDTIRLATSGTKRKRMDFRVRHTSGYLRYVGKVELVCSERCSRPDGRRKYLACNDLRATPRQIVTGYRMRWAVELFHKCVKQHLGFEDVATHSFDAVMSHVHWVYCAYILLHMSPLGLSPGSQSIGEKQRALQQGLADQEKRQILQKLTQIGGVQRYKAELRQALAGT